VPILVVNVVVLFVSAIRARAHRRCNWLDAATQKTPASVAPPLPSTSASCYQNVANCPDRCSSGTAAKPECVAWFGTIPVRRERANERTNNRKVSRCAKTELDGWWPSLLPEPWSQGLTSLIPIWTATPSFCSSAKNDGRGRVHFFSSRFSTVSVTVASIAWQARACDTPTFMGGWMLL